MHERAAHTVVHIAHLKKPPQIAQNTHFNALSQRHTPAKRRRKCDNMNIVKSLFLNKFIQNDNLLFRKSVYTISVIRNAERPNMLCVRG